MENYSIQAKNLIESIIDEYGNKLKNIHKDYITLHEVKKIRIQINKRYRNFSDIAEIKNDNHNSFFEIIVFNTDYIELVLIELDNLELSYTISGQFIKVSKPIYSFNQLMIVIDEIEKLKNKTISMCTKAKHEPIIRSKTALENQFIDPVISRQTSDNCQKIFHENEKKIEELTIKRIKEILGEKFFEKYLLEV